MKRRTFLKLCGTTIAVAPWVKLGGLAPARAADGNDSVLVIIDLLGGNDGLNTVIPVGHDEYYRQRGALAVSREDAIDLTDELGLHPSLEALVTLWDEGHLAIVNGVGYPEPDLSHFRSRDTWHGATTAERIETGWIGRYFEMLTSKNVDVTEADPAGIEFLSNNSLLMQASQGPLGIAITDPDAFYEMSQALVDIARSPASDSYAGQERDYIQYVSDQVQQSAQRIFEAYTSVENEAVYPQTDLASQLARIARMISGGLKTCVYQVSLGGFDTHSNQLRTHPVLLETLAEAVAAFMDDLASSGQDDRVTVMTTSEFGRRVQFNGSGTDHGTAAPHFLAGTSVQGGFYGAQPDITNLDANGNLQYSIDFRQIYASVLQEWFKLSRNDTAEVLGDEYEQLSLFK